MSLEDWPFSRMVSKTRTKDFCADENIQLIETSAATGSNVEEAFMKLARAIRKKFDPKDSRFYILANFKPCLRLSGELNCTSRFIPQMTSSILI